MITSTRHLRARRLSPLAALLAGLWCGASTAADALVAAASNFASTLATLEQQFERSHPHTVRITLGSTGKLYAQIRNGAPYDIFLSADQARAEQLIANGLARADTRFTYAVGRLSLWSAESALFSEKGAPEFLLSRQYRALAIANPKTAPYGLAAREALRALGLWKRVRDKLVMGQNVGQTFTLVASGNARLGFIATPQLAQWSNGSRWDVPAHLFPPVRQDGVMLQRADGNRAAAAFHAFLQTAEARDTITRAGYGLD